MSKRVQKIVVGEFSEEGYEVQVVSGTRIFHSYAASNHPQDSAQKAAPGSALPLRRLHKLCIHTVREMAQQYRARDGGVKRKHLQ